ncbi:MAG: rod shape-determining protein MreC [Alphaproteobacteria bacterium]|nr:rod shape-determining protein MreC [Alphaproteobacteria bacterium]MBV9554975.1 rod shape-determining protein MreC [Alphaproteobacteria bacterium]
MIRLSPQMRTAIQRTTLPVLVLLSGAIVVLGKADQLVFDSLRIAVSDAVAPVLDAAAQPLNAVGAVVDHAKMAVATYRENVRLEAENQRLLQWQQTALNLAADNKQLRGLLKAVPENALSYVTARVVANSGGAFVRMILINAGTDDHVSRGQAVMTGEGLVGRLTEVGERAARVLLITDLNSRIPVTVERSHAAAVLAGDNSERPRLLYLSAGDGAKAGDRIVTSGEGGVFPPGLPVGVVASIDGAGARVEPYVELSQLGYVLVADYGLSRSLPQPLPVLARPNRRSKTDADEPNLR